jgi:hypothetical protein
VHEALLSRSRLRPDQLYKLGSALAAWGAEGRTPTIDALALSADLGERATNALLVAIEEAGYVRFTDSSVEVTIPADTVESEVRSLAGQFATLRTQDSRRLDSVGDYAHSNECRAVYLRRYFGEDNGEPCGLCDICRGRPERPSTFWQPVAAPQRGRKKRRRGRRQGPSGRGERPTAPPAVQAQGQAGAAANNGDRSGRRSSRRRRRRGRRSRSGGQQHGRPPQGPPPGPPPPAES